MQNQESASPVDLIQVTPDLIQHSNNSKHHDDASHDSDDRALKAPLWRIIGLGIAVVIVLGLYSYFYPFVTERFKFWTTVSVQVLVLMAILVQALIYIKQSEAMREGIKIARQSMIFAQRAYVMVTADEVVEDAHPSLLQMSIKNSGNTPAHKVEIFVTMQRLEQPPVPDNHPLDWIGIGAIAPHSFITNYVEIGYADGRGAGNLYCWGVIRYETFGEIRHSRFSFILKGWPAFARCEKGNEAE